jgi:hypothetical protein
MGPRTLRRAFDEQSRLESELMKARIKTRLFGQPAAALRLGRFELLRPLGRGSFGSVYEARDVGNGAVVALKLLRARDAGAVHAFKREFRGLTDLVHENLAQLYELFTDEDEWYFTMELVRGLHFIQHVRRRGPGARGCDVERLRAAFTQLLSAVQAIHAAGKLHCDLKPGNALVTEAGRLVVLDFGLMTWQRATCGVANQASAGAYGTPPYMAPELAAGQLPSRASDAYGVGAMLFEALTGRPPLEGLADESGVGAVAPHASSVADQLPDDLDEVCAALLEHDPAARMTIEAALERLQAAAVPARGGAGMRVSAPFVGRSVELSALHAACADVQLGQPIALLLSGRSGIGKTALVARFVEQLRGQATVLHCRCHERESVPYKAFDGLVDALAEELTPLSRTELGISAARPARCSTCGPTWGAGPSSMAAGTRLFPRAGASRGSWLSRDSSSCCAGSRGAGRSCSSWTIYSGPTSIVPASCSSCSDRPRRRPCFTWVLTAAKRSSAANFCANYCSMARPRRGNANGKRSNSVHSTKPARRRWP